MAAGFNLILAVVVCLFLGGAAVAAAKRPNGAWNYYHFDGSRFVAGLAADGKRAVAVRDGVRPVVALPGARIEAVALPAGTGAVAGICYIQSAGGKLTGGAGYLAAPAMRLPISSGTNVVTTVQTDEQGYFIAVLPAGRYVVGEGPLARNVRVESDQTSLIALRVGKRMVD
ncbi:hypothetical protein F6V25_09605 [Oryzomonas japonica]|uniref:Carboxypeptidase regulatory-like domain-containing protein n=1 Tax=Oryzomonas japonica TaxID=2603858 RepID=A0A7J4ZQH2_9BACT|nr:hypothetical protein [Oryzomonas japonica]KAB0665334.1 hypothetical protein F6V25_09605 [Oryzomonas japonica]